MRKLTAAELALTEAGDCTVCGTFARYRNTAGMCGDCHNANYQRQRAERRAELASLPRCEGCQRRASYTAMGVGLCGKHLNTVQARLAGRMGIFGLATAITPAMIRDALSH